MSLAVEKAAPPTFEWKRWPEAEAFVGQLLTTALEGNAFAAGLAERMLRETGTQFAVWVNHLVVPGGDRLMRRLVELGFERQRIMYSVGSLVFAHPGGIFPRIVVQADGAANGPGATAPKVREVAIKVESVAAFSRAHDLGLEITGYALGPYRVARMPGAHTTLAIVERRGYLGFEPFPGELARRAHEAAGRARRAGGPRFVAGPAPAVRRRRSGFRRHRGDARTSDRARRLD